MTDIRVLPQPWLWVPRTKPIRMIEIHATRGNTTPAQQKGACLNWVMSPYNVGNTKPDGTPDYQNPQWGSSFSHVIGSDGSEGTALNDNQMPTYSAGYGGPTSDWAIDEYAISYELAQSQAQEPFTEACLHRAAREIAEDCTRYGIPPVFIEVWSQAGPVPTGLVRHDRCQNGVVLGKNDPGYQFDEVRFSALVRAEMERTEMPMTQAEFNKMFAVAAKTVKLEPFQAADSGWKRFRAGETRTLVNWLWQGLPIMVRHPSNGRLYGLAFGVLIHIPSTTVKNYNYLFNTGFSEMKPPTSDSIWKMPRIENP